MTYLESIRIKTEAALEAAAQQAALEATAAAAEAKESAAAVFDEALESLREAIETAAGAGKYSVAVDMYHPGLALDSNEVLLAMLLGWLESNGFAYTEAFAGAAEVRW